METGTGIKRGAVAAGGVAATVAGFIFAEGWLILAVKVFGFALATAIVTVVTAVISWAIIYLASGSRNITRFNAWLKEKEAGLSGRAMAAVKGGIVIAVVNTTVLLGPIVASVLMLMLGVDRKKAYIYSGLGALLCAAIWCGFYSGLFWGIHEMITGAKK
jgi:hypothetical protein